MSLLDTNVVSAFLKPDANEKTPELDRLIRELFSIGPVAISYVTQYELRRGAQLLASRGQGRRKLVTLLKFLAECDALGLDAVGGAGWNHAALLWTQLSAHKPSITLTDADLLIAATAGFHKRTLVTCDGPLVENLKAIGRDDVKFIPLA